MNRRTILLSLFFLAVPFVLHVREKVDGIAAIIYGSDETIIVTLSELRRPGLEGQMKSLDDLILEVLIFLDAKRMGVIPDPEAMQRHWESIKKQNNLSEDDMRAVAEQAGYTLAEAKMHLGRMSAINQMIDMKVKAGLFVTKQEVERYYKEHPEIEPAVYEISRALAPFNTFADENELGQYLLKHGEQDPQNFVRWSQPFTLLQTEIAADKKFICSLKIGEISRPVKTAYGFEFFKLISKIPERLVPLAERYDAIEYALKTPKYKELMDAYKKELYSKATIVRYVD